jgi:hypothetical protein
VWGLEAPEIPRQGISGSPTRNIRFPAGGVLYVQLMLTHEKVEFLGSEIVQNLLSLTVHLPALQNMVITKHKIST